MKFNINLSDRVREILAEKPNIEVEEKEMFGGLFFLVNGKICISVVKDWLMCRFDPKILDEISDKEGFIPLIMKGKQLKGYCYVEEIGYQKRKDLGFWIDICLDFNKLAKSLKK